ncbi:alkaline ceramidase 1 isoform X1 [Lepisosteus oculatus]|uniref:alkaline ceramidase 1 isoform X1 n=2 Tax=Lepisosteus oculatus TaxID=7918 RepID=UPI00073FC570|nr:PREDICTED: alkaline ceramidase 1 isoform X1 [Lepisosteus oculatus]
MLGHTCQVWPVQRFSKAGRTAPRICGMAGVFSYESSEVDWCEDNYRHSETVAEFYNTVSSFIFFLFSPLMLYLLHPYAKERSRAVHLVWFMMIFVGIFSIYFHMTLSYVGQMLDEISILWVLAVGYALWFPRKHFPSFIKNRVEFSVLVFLTTVFSTLSSFAKPTVNAYALNCIALHILYCLGLELRSCTNPRIHRLARVSVFWWALAIACWLSDRFLCNFWKRINFCYLHSIWHVLIVVATAHGSTLIAYFDALHEIPHALPEIQYWPKDHWSLGVPFIAIRGSSKTQKEC